MELSVHDNHILGYLVRSDERTIVVYTEYPYREVRERTNVHFSDVVVYDFESDNFGSILYDIYEEPPIKVIERSAALFDRLSSYGWPGGQYTYNTLPELAKKLADDGVRAFSISPSVGMTGFVLARTMEFRSA